MQISGEKLNKLRTVSLPRPPEPAVRPASLRGCALAGSTESKSPPGRCRRVRNQRFAASLCFAKFQSGSIGKRQTFQDGRWLPCSSHAVLHLQSPNHIRTWTTASQEANSLMPFQSISSYVLVPSLLWGGPVWCTTYNPLFSACMYKYIHI